MSAMERPRIAPNSSGARNAPFLSLDDAVDRARTLYQKAKRNAINVSTAAVYLGYSRKASNFTLTIAALKKYGLLLDEGSSEGRRVKLTETAIQILADTREISADREKTIRQVALLPKAHRELWQQFGSDAPDDETLEVYLKLEKGYTEDAARSVVRVYRRTILYAGLHQQGILGDVAAEDVEMDSASTERIADKRAPMDRQNSTTEWTQTNGESPVRTLSIPLGGSRTFDIRFPTDLSKEDFDFIVENMKLWERQIVASDK